MIAMQTTLEIIRTCAEKIAFFEFTRDQLRAMSNFDNSSKFATRLAEVEEKISKYDAELRLAMRNYLATKSTA